MPNLMISLLDKKLQPIGAFTREQISARLQTGETALTDYAHVEGLNKWTPLGEVLDHLDGKTPSGSAFVPVGDPLAENLEHAGYAGFWLRVAAYIIDRIIIDIPLLPFSFVVGVIYGIAEMQHDPHPPMGFLNKDGSLNVSFCIFELCMVLFALVVNWLYFSLQESSSAQATVGKRLLKLKVTDLSGNRISFGHATGRYFGKILSGITLGFGFMMAGFTEYKQALHDMLAGTLVVKK